MRLYLSELVSLHHLGLKGHMLLSFNSRYHLHLSYHHYLVTIVKLLLISFIQPSSSSIPLDLSIKLFLKQLFKSVETEVFKPSRVGTMGLSFSQALQDLL